MALYKKTLHTYLLWMREMIQKIETYTKDYKTLQDFAADEKTIDAVITPLIQIGEIAGRMEKLYPDTIDIPYRDIIGMRNILVYMYHKVDAKVLWFTITHSLPTLKTILQKYFIQNKIDPSTIE